MANRDIEFRVGVVVFLGLIILAGSLYWLQGYRLERNAQQIRIRFPDVGTLAVGDRVTVSGVHRGKVRQMRLTDDGVEVMLLLHRDVKLRSDARFIIRNLGLMGERYIAIKPGSDSLPFDTSQVVDGHYDTGLPEVMGLMGEMITELHSLVASIKQTVGSDSSLARFNSTVANFERVSGSLADYLQHNESRLDQTADNFLKASRRLNAILDIDTDKLDSTLERFDRTSIGLERFTFQLDTLARAARTFADDLNQSDGTLRMLIEDRRLYDDLRQVADNMDDLIADIRANPRKYINLKVELF